MLGSISGRARPFQKGSRYPRHVDRSGGESPGPAHKEALLMRTRVGIEHPPEGRHADLQITAARPKRSSSYVARRREAARS